VIFFQCLFFVLINFNLKNLREHLLGNSLFFSANASVVIKSRSVFNSNELCRFKTNIDANNPIAIKHYRENIQRYMPEFNECFKKEKANDLIKIDENNTLQIDIDGILKRYDLSIKLECYAQTIDKTMDKKERNYNLLYSHRYLVKSKLILNEHGFYYIHCVDEMNKLRVIHQDIRLVLPKYMSYLKVKSLPYKQKLEVIRDEQIDSDNSVNPLLTDLNLLNDQCLLNTATEEAKKKNEFNSKMNVLILGIDSLSFPHLKRSFPRFYKFLSQELNGNVFYENLNKVGENTYRKYRLFIYFPHFNLIIFKLFYIHSSANLLAMFAGVKIEPSLEMNISQADIDAYYNWDKNLTNHDLIPFIWHSFDKDLKYLTMFNEEWAYFGCFNYLKEGNSFQTAIFIPINKLLNVSASTI